MMKKISAVLISTVSVFFFAVPAFAHVIVKPSQVNVAQIQVFSMSVPNEKTSSTIGIKLMIPAGLAQVVPNVKPGWTINVVKNGDTVTEIDWTGGNIPPEQRDEFLFEAQVLAKATTIKWKAYQIYQDGSTVAWVNNPTSNPEDDSAPPPYSQTKVINDLTGSSQSSNNTTISDISKKATFSVGLSVAAIALSLLAIRLSTQKKQ